MSLLISSEIGFDPERPTRVEICLDQGVVTTDTGHGPACGEKIHEVEIELLDGDADALFEIAQRLGSGIRLTPCDISKAERGYRLLGGV
jgi:inorganic triphosphatase YgiF